MLALSNVSGSLRYRNVAIDEKEYIHEVYNIASGNLPHMVWLHGFGATSMAFIKMFEPFKDRFQIHALDTFGMGLSSRGNWKDSMKRE